MIYEIRVYRCVPGRLPALLKRFETITLKLWEKHGIRQAGFWTTLVGESNQDLTYMLAWESLAERDQKWGAFSTDPEWVSKRAETEKKAEDKSAAKSTSEKASGDTVKIRRKEPEKSSSMVWIAVFLAVAAAVAAWKLWLSH